MKRRAVLRRISKSRKSQHQHGGQGNEQAGTDTDTNEEALDVLGAADRELAQMKADTAARDLSEVGEAGANRSEPVTPVDPNDLPPE